MKEGLPGPVGHLSVARASNEKCQIRGTRGTPKISISDNGGSLAPWL